MGIAMTATGADKPVNLSGKWTLDKDKSEFARGAPDSMTAVIADDGKKIHLTETVGSPEGERVVEMNMERDAESVNHSGDMEMRTKLRQDGARLLEETHVSGPRGELTRKSTITLSADGKTMIMDSDYESPDGAFHEKIVLERVD
jgi:hypothetical protein